MNRTDPIVDGCWYHVANKGVDQCQLFRSRDDYHWFLSLLGDAATAFDCFFLAWALLPDLFRLIMMERNGGNLPGAMHVIDTALAKRVNFQRRRTGRILHGPYQNCRLRSDEETLSVAAYLHAEPEIREYIADAGDWPWSSLRMHCPLPLKRPQPSFPAIPDSLLARTAHDSLIHLATRNNTTYPQMICAMRNSGRRPHRKLLLL